MVNLVERGAAPKTLPIDFNDSASIQHEHILCPYPEKAKLKENGPDYTKRVSWVCAP